MERLRGSAYSRPKPPARRDGVIVIGSTWSALLVGMSLVVAAVFAGRAALAAPHGAALAAHAVMGAAMASMFWPFGDPLPAAVGIAVFAVLGAWFATGWLRSGAGRIDCGAHVAVGSGAMVLMYLTHGSGGHVGHGAAVAGGAGMLLAAAGLTLTGYFLWYAWESVPRVRATALAAAGRHRPAGAAGLAPGIAQRVESVAHVVMSLLMAVMFLGTL